jgi:hypothetical protein
MRGRAMLVGLVAVGMALAGRAEAQIMPTRGAARGWLGIMFEPAENDGALVVDEVFRGSPAQRVGVQPGDTVVLWNGRRDVAGAMQARTLQPGDTVRVRIRRGSQRDQDLAIVAGQRPVAVSGATMRRGGDGTVVVIRPGEIERQMRILTDSIALHVDSLHQRIQILMRDSIAPRMSLWARTQLPELQRSLRDMVDAMPTFDGDTFVLDLGRRSVAGAEFTELNEGLAGYFGTAQGLLVIKVASETPAARSGLLAGDVVLRVDGQAVATVGDLRRAVSQAERTDSRRVRVDVLRKGQRSDLEMRWE